MSLLNKTALYIFYQELPSMQRISTFGGIKPLQIRDIKLWEDPLDLANKAERIDLTK
jgi:hypothetical protein